MDTQNKKYELLTNDTIKHNGRTLYRIKALRDIPRYNVKAGDLGGYIQSEDNLSQTGDCWIDDNTKVYGNTQVYGDVHVSDNAKVFGNAEVYGDAIVSGDERINTGVRNGESTTDTEPEAKNQRHQRNCIGKVCLKRLLT